MKLRRRIGSVFLAFAMALSLVPSVAVSALAATSSSNQGYFTFDYDNQGTNKRTVTVNLYDPDEQLLDTLTVTDVRSRNEDYTIALTNKAIDTYDIESVSVNGGNVTLPTRYKDSYEFRMDLELVSSSTINVYLCPEFKAPEIVGEVERGDLYYRITEASLLKLLHDNEVEVDAETTFPDQRGVKLHFVEEYLTFSEWSLDRALSAGNNLLYYQNGAALSNIEEEAGPGNIQYIEIPYQLSDGTKGSKKIYSGDLKYIKVSDTTYEIESKKNQDEHIVIFYTEGNTPDDNIWTPLNVRFVKTDQPVAKSEADMPTADTYLDRDFVAWTQQHNGGLPVLYNTLVKDDMNVFPQYKLWTTDNPTEIRVMNNDDLLQKRVAELLGCSVDAIDWGSMKITVHGQGNAATNPDYGAPGGIHNDWNDEEDRDFYKVYNYRTGAEGTAYENKPIPVDKITSISVSVCKVGETDYEKSVEIEKGAFAGDFAISMGNLSGDWRVELYINAEGDYPENPDTPDPGTDPAITDFSKDLVSSETAVPEGITATGYTFPNEDGTVIIPYGEEVTLLYAITVTGKEGATFTVTDQGAQLVTVSNVSVTQSGNDFSGTISDTGSITFYVSKSFEADDIVDGKLTNTAELTGDNAPEDNEATEEVDAEEESHPIYAYVQFIGSGAEGALTKEEQEYVTDTFGCTLHGNNNDYVAIGSFDWNIPDPSGSEYAPEEGAYANDENFFDSLLGDSFAFPEDYTQHEDAGNNFPVDKVDWNKLTTAKGAGQFDEVGVDTVCWHLDGQIQLYAPDISVDKELTKVVRDGNEVPNISTDTVLEVGDQLTWTITVTNSGNADATGLKLEDVLKAGENTIEAGYTIASSSDKDNFSVAAKGEEGDEVIFTATYTVTNADKGLTLKNTATVTNGDDEEEGEGSTENEVANPAVDVTKALTSAKRGDNTTTSDLDTYKAQVGDELTYTITVKNTGNVALENVTVEDSLWIEGTDLTITSDGTSYTNQADANGSYTPKGVEIAPDATLTITYTYTVTEADALKEAISNSVDVYLDSTEPGGGEDPDGEDDVTVEMDNYTIDIAPANITIYTGGKGYAGVLENAEGVLLDEPTSGLPEPGYHIELPDAVDAWLEAQGISTSTAEDLSELLHFAYDEDEQQREWGLTYMGVYDANAAGEATQYVYSLNPAVVDGEEVPVSILFTDDAGTPVTSDDIDMSATAASAKYTISINPGELKQNEIQAVFTVTAGDGTEKSITCNVEVSTGELTVKSTTDDEYVNEIGTVENNQISATGEGVTYYVNDSQVTVDSSRVGLLVDSVSNDETFNQNMENDAISEVTGVSDAQAQSYYLDLVDTDNGNAVVTPSDDVTIYWPMPEDADPTGDFYIVHYTEMDRENTTMQETPTVTKVNATADDNHLTFTTDSFSPFVLVYEQKDSGGPVTPPVEDDDDDTPPPVNPNPPQLNTEDHYAYIVGYEDGTVRPEGDITRAEVATIFFRLLTDESRDEYWSQDNNYTDVAEGDWYNNAVSTLSKAGILNGYEDGSFQPNGNITRAEFATIAARFFEATYEGEDLFPDIEDHWARDYINQAAHAGIVNGYPNGTFQPQENITRAEAMTIVNRTLDRHPDADHFLADMITWPDNLESAWYYEQVQEATNSHEYIMKTDADKNPYEIWKEILPVRDWSDLENTWSEAHAG